MGHTGGGSNTAGKLTVAALETGAALGPGIAPEARGLAPYFTPFLGLVVGHM
ncbi:MAG: hypothetical protein LBB68_06110 [Treponema sp.]|nr:hypothetical protein [Treponema sp.]